MVYMRTLSICAQVGAASSLAEAILSYILLYTGRVYCHIQVGAASSLAEGERVVARALAGTSRTNQDHHVPEGACPSVYRMIDMLDVAARGRRRQLVRPPP